MVADLKGAALGLWRAPGTRQPLSTRGLLVTNPVSVSYNLSPVSLSAARVRRSYALDWLKQEQPNVNIPLLGWLTPVVHPRHKSSTGAPSCQTLHPFHHNKTKRAKPRTLTVPNQHTCPGFVAQTTQTMSLTTCHK